MKTWRRTTGCTAYDRYKTYWKLTSTTRSYSQLDRFPIRLLYVLCRDTDTPQRHLVGSVTNDSGSWRWWNIKKHVWVMWSSRELISNHISWYHSASGKFRSCTSFNLNLFSLHMHVKLWFSHRLKTAKMANSRTNA